MNISPVNQGDPIRATHINSMIRAINQADGPGPPGSPLLLPGRCLVKTGKHWPYRLGGLGPGSSVRLTGGFLPSEEKAGAVRQRFMGSSGVCLDATGEEELSPPVTAFLLESLLTGEEEYYRCLIPGLAPAVAAKGNYDGEHFLYHSPAGSRPASWSYTGYGPWQIVARAEAGPEDQYDFCLVVPTPTGHVTGRLLASYQAGDAWAQVANERLGTIRCVCPLLGNGLLAEGSQVVVSLNAATGEPEIIQAECP